MLLSLLAFPLLLAAVKPDLDADGLPDRFEQELLIRFLPQFQISRRECDGLPAEFAPDSIAPVVIDRNGTIYGRAVPLDAGGKGKPAIIEIQYFHLWGRDCGLLPHRFDVEHVSALLSASNLKQPAKKWKAVTWYAGAHEDTLCDNSSAESAKRLAAESKGPAVWISRGKHASYFDRQKCSAGCRADDCADESPLAVRRVINLGEPGRPLNGALFVQSRRWRFLDKLNEKLYGMAQRL